MSGVAWGYARGRYVAQEGDVTLLVRKRRGVNVWEWTVQTDLHHVRVCAASTDTHTVRVRIEGVTDRRDAALAAAAACLPSVQAFADATKTGTVVP